MVFVWGFFFLGNSVPLLVSLDTGSDNQLSKYKSKLKINKRSRTVLKAFPIFCFDRYLSDEEIKIKNKRVYI